MNDPFPSFTQDIWSMKDKMKRDKIPHSILENFTFWILVYERQDKKGRSFLSILEMIPRWRGAFPFEPPTLDHPFPSGLWKIRWKGTILPLNLGCETKMERGFFLLNLLPWTIPFHLTKMERGFSHLNLLPWTIPFHLVCKRQDKKGQSSLSILDVIPRWRGAFFLSKFLPWTIPFHLVYER